MAEEQHHGPLPKEVAEEEEPARLARRKLLRLVAYAAPVIIGSFAARDAAAASCAPNAGCSPHSPCNPACFPHNHR